jgi:hypothetical protein
MRNSYIRTRVKTSAQICFQNCQGYFLYEAMRAVQMIKEKLVYLI